MTNPLLLRELYTEARLGAPRAPHVPTSMQERHQAVLREARKAQLRRQAAQELGEEAQPQPPLEEDLAGVDVEIPLEHSAADDAEDEEEVSGEIAPLPARPRPRAPRTSPPFPRRTIASLPVRQSPATLEAALASASDQAPPPVS